MQLQLCNAQDTLHDFDFAESTNYLPLVPPATSFPIGFHLQLQWRLIASSRLVVFIRSESQHVFHVHLFPFRIQIPPYKLDYLTNY